MIGCLSHAPNWGLGHTTQACALTGNRTTNLSVHRLALSPLSHTSQGFFLMPLKILFIFRERGRARKKGRETFMCGCLLCAPYQVPGLQPRHMLRLFSLQAHTQATEPHQPGLSCLLKMPCTLLKYSKILV